MITLLNYRNGSCIKFFRLIGALTAFVVFIANAISDLVDPDQTLLSGRLILVLIVCSGLPVQKLRASNPGLHFLHRSSLNHKQRHLPSAGKSLSSYGAARNAISCRMIPKLNTSPFWEAPTTPIIPAEVRRCSGAVHNNSVTCMTCFVRKWVGGYI